MLIFDPEKVYLLIGCLGGLGRSLSHWMISRGARHFVFLGSPSSDKPSAQDLVSRLENAGAHVTVVRGDVVQAADIKRSCGSLQSHWKTYWRYLAVHDTLCSSEVRAVTSPARKILFLASKTQELTSQLSGEMLSRLLILNAAVEACKATGKPIGGVIQATMGLHEALFTRMSHQGWHTGIQPKWKGTWNLHNALEGNDEALDFFLLTSSVSGSVATATESNYCVVNGFLDPFARWRRSQGKKAISAGLGIISEVGHLHKNPEIEALLLRKGIQPLNEEEFLHVIDLSLSGPGGDFEATGVPAHSVDYTYMLTGLKPPGLRKLLDKGFDITTIGNIVGM
ncbi:hypothetical protein ACMFMG_001189 [Clarireedia jacksonii]